MPSPTISSIKAKKTMDFYDALREVSDGKKVTRLSWQNPNLCVFMHKEFLCHQRSDGSINGLALHRLDIEGIDWVVVLEN